MASRDVDCDFCSEIDSGLIGETYRVPAGVESRIIEMRNSTLVVPTISPVAANHLLLIPHQHVTSCAQLGADDLADLADTLSDLRSRLQTSNDMPLVVFEHGVGRGGIGGCGVSHCHVHAVPLHYHQAHQVVAEFKSAWRERAPTGEHIDESTEYLSLEVIGDDVKYKAIRTGNFHSQCMRNLIERALGLPATNWRDMVRQDIFTQTIQSHISWD